MNRLTIENVSRNFGGVRALDDVSFVVEPGTIHGLIGPNGAGKTTFLKTILEQIPPLAGTVSLGASLTVGYFAQAQDFPDPDSLITPAALPPGFIFTFAAG